MLKTAGYGYDGKGQIKITSPEQAASALASVPQQELVLEGFVDFQCEVSVIGARGLDGGFANWGVIENSHRNHILDLSVAPASVDERVARQAIEIARTVLEKLDVIGLLCVEFFLTQTGDLLINELAPRPHNSGHLTFDACVTSQFETTVAGSLWLATRLDGNAPPGCYGQSSWVPVAGRRNPTGARPALFQMLSCIYTENLLQSPGAKWAT